jgi:hypothetical protein
MMYRDVSDRIERLESTEEHLRVALSALSAQIDVSDLNRPSLIVGGEIRPSEGSKLRQDMTLVIAVYDTQGRVVESLPYDYYSDDFFALATFSFAIQLTTQEVGKVLIYFKRGD